MKERGLIRIAYINNEEQYVLEINDGNGWEKAEQFPCLPDEFGFNTHIGIAFIITLQQYISLGYRLVR